VAKKNNSFVIVAISKPEKWKTGKELVQWVKKRKLKSISTTKSNG